MTYLHIHWSSTGGVSIQTWVGAARMLDKFITARNTERVYCNCKGRFYRMQRHD